MPLDAPLTVKPRALETVPETASVPPESVTPPEASPRLPSLVIDSWPAEIVVPPV